MGDVVFSSFTSRRNCTLSEVRRSRSRLISPSAFCRAELLAFRANAWLRTPANRHSRSTVAGAHVCSDVVDPQTSAASAVSSPVGTGTAAADRSPQRRKNSRSLSGMSCRLPTQACVGSLHDIPESDREFLHRWLRWAAVVRCRPAMTPRLLRWSAGRPHSEQTWAPEPLSTGCALFAGVLEPGICAKGQQFRPAEGAWRNQPGCAISLTSDNVAVSPRGEAAGDVVRRSSRRAPRSSRCSRKSNRSRRRRPPSCCSARPAPGKEVLAQAIHELSPRARRPMVARQLRGDPAALSRASSSATRGRVHRRARRGRSAASSWPTRRRCSSTRSASCRRCRSSCCACCRSARSSASAAPQTDQGRRPHHRRDQPRPRAGGRDGRFARTCSIGSTSSRSTCRRCASGVEDIPTLVWTLHRRVLEARSASASTRSPRTSCASCSVPLARQRPRAAQRRRARDDCRQRAAAGGSGRRGHNGRGPSQHDADRRWKATTSAPCSRAADWRIRGAGGAAERLRLQADDAREPDGAARHRAKESELDSCGPLKADTAWMSKNAEPCARARFRVLDRRTKSTLIELSPSVAARSRCRRSPAAPGRCCRRRRAAARRRRCRTCRATRR